MCGFKSIWIRLVGVLDSLYSAINSTTGKNRSTIKMRTSLAVDGTLAIITTTSTSVAVSYLVTLGGAFLVFSVSIERSECVVNSS